MEQEHKIRVSIVTPCYNDGMYLMDAVDSAKEAVKSGFCEHIIVDDASDDQYTLDLYKKLESEGMHIIYSDKVGLGGVRNVGIRAAKAEYILSLDADNRIHTDYPFKAAPVLDKFPEIGIVYSDRESFGRKVKIQTAGPFDLDNLLKSNFIDTCAVFRKKVWEDTGGFDEKEMILEDWNFWLGAAAKNWKFHYLNEVLYYYRYRLEETSLLDQSKDRLEEVRNYIAQKHGPFYRENYFRVLQEKRDIIKKGDFPNHVMEKEIYQMKNSLSWKITKPLRTLGSIFRKK